MSKPIVIYWPPANILITTQAVAPQDSDILFPGGSFEYDGMIRSFDIVRGDAVAGVQYVITGIGCTVDSLSTPDAVIPTSALGPTSETINAAGPGFAAKTTKIYKKITSVRVIGGAATNVQVFYGDFGITEYINVDYNRDSPPLDLYSLQFISHVSMYGSVWISLNKPENATKNGSVLPFGYINGVNVLPAGTFIPAFPLTAPTQQKVLNGTQGGIAVIWASVTACDTDSMFFTFTQSGSR